MASRKKQPAKITKKSYFEDVSVHTKQAIWAVMLFFLAVFIIISLMHSAGMVGDWTYTGLTFLLGGGAYLAPVACFFYIYVLFNPKEDSGVSTSKIFGITLLFFSLLGFMTLSSSGLGGALGSLLATPLIYLMGNLAAGIVLGTLLFISIFLTFNTGLALPAFLKKREPVVNENADIDDLQLSKDDDREIEEETSNEDTASESLPAKAAPLKVMERLGLNREKPFTDASYTGPYTAPPLSLLTHSKGRAKTGDVKANANTIKQTLKNFGIEVEMDQVEIGPTVTRYALKPAQGVKISKIVGLQRELELNLAAGTIRIEAPIPGKSLVGIEVPNIEKATIGLASLLASPEFTDSPHPLLVALGKDITGKAHFANVARMPHGLIAGTTGSGKSALIHDLVLSLLYRNSPEQLRMIMVDPKRVELTLYNGIPHLLSEVITDAKKALMALKWAVGEMDRRYDILQSKKVQNIASYHKNIYQAAKDAYLAKGSPEDEKDELPEPLPYIVVVMDELADLMHAYPRELEAAIVRLAQMSRAVGIHLLLATQRPSVNVITGTIKANIPTRLAMQVASQIDSRTILDQAGAEKLLGQGDMLFLSGEMSKPTRLQSAYVSEDELKKVVEFLKHQTDLQELDSIDFGAKGDGPGEESIYGSAVDDADEDNLYQEAKQTVIDTGRASTSFLQRKLRIGYSRAARLVDMLEERGVVGAQDGSKPREILTQSDTEVGSGGDDDNDNIKS